MIAAIILIVVLFVVCIVLGCMLITRDDEVPALLLKEIVSTIAQIKKTNEILSKQLQDTTDLLVYARKDLREKEKQIEVLSFAMSISSKDYSYLQIQIGRLEGLAFSISDERIQDGIMKTAGAISVTLRKYDPTDIHGLNYKSALDELEKRYREVTTAHNGPTDGGQT